ncbi:MAG: 4'-phosphopantetheinyl transferase superfamily protein [Cytophagales bacterium]|nr:4'-phosphopantetheinyl transferase superfamily protein [Cytophagales bacterium]
MPEIYYCIVDEVDHLFFESCLKELPENIRKEVTKYRFVKDQKLTLYGKWMVSSFFRQKQIPFNWMDWKKGSFGKPFLPYGPYFNVSHCESLVVVVFYEEIVGIDVEKVSEKNLDLIAMLHPNEQNYIAGSQSKEAAFCEIWTKKEAYLKAKGCGLQQELNVFDCSKDCIDDELGSWNMISLDFLDDYRLSVCTTAKGLKTGNFHPSIKNIRHLFKKC